MTVKERCEIAKKYREIHMNCNQCILVAFRDILGLTEAQCWALGSGFGSGVRCGGICGAVTAPVMVLGAVYPYGPDDGDEAKARSEAMTKEFERRYAEKFGHLNCEVLKPRESAEGTALTRELGATAVCSVYILTAIEILCDMLGISEG